MKVSTRLPVRLLAFTALLIAVVGCSSDTSDTTTTTRAPNPSTTSTSTTVPPSTTTTAGATAEPDVRTEIDWFISVLNGTELTEEEYQERFTEEFREQVPYAEGIVPVLDEFRPQGPYVTVENQGEGTSGEAVIESEDGTRFRVLAELNEESQFSALLIQPADTPTLDDPPGNVDEAFERLGEIGTVRALTAEVVDGQCEPIAGSSSEDPAPLGSAFKLYVLAALGEAVESGDIAWDDDLVIRDELKSVPSGTLQDREAGETVTVTEAASLMISISDNTATDHLIDLIGRETVESAMVDYGNTTPGLNTPLLNTREFTALKVGPASGLRVQWVDGDEEARRALLDQIADITPGDLPVQEWTEPIDPDVVEWFASPADLCALAVGLADLAASVPEIGEILSINPGVPADPGTWESIWFKGGSEPGLAAAWFVTESDGRTFVTAGSVVDPESTIDTQEAILLFAAARDLLAP